MTDLEIELDFWACHFFDAERSGASSAEIGAMTEDEYHSPWTEEDLLRWAEEEEDAPPG